jgi:hypothetical protein
LANPELNVPTKSFGVAKNTWISLKTSLKCAKQQPLERSMFLLSGPLIFFKFHCGLRECELAEKHFHN